MARGRRDESVMWVHEDSGAKADVHALSLTGQKRQTFRLTGVTAKDWEDMDVGRGPQAGVNYLYLGDIGGKSRTTITINRVPEPAVTGAAASPTWAGRSRSRPATPTASRNAESMAVGADGTIYIITKEASTRVYAIPFPQSTSSVITMKRIDAGWLASRTDMSGADIRPDGRALIVRGYRKRVAVADRARRVDGDHAEAHPVPDADVPRREAGRGDRVPRQRRLVHVHRRGCGRHRASVQALSPRS